MAVQRDKEGQPVQVCSSQKESSLEQYGQCTESLLGLVQPELSNLSSHWFYALRDHALLCLPPGKSPLAIPCSCYLLHKSLFITLLLFLLLRSVNACVLSPMI